MPNLDGEAKEAAETMRDTFTQIGETGDPSALRAPETADAITTVGRLCTRAASCGPSTSARSSTCSRTLRRRPTPAGVSFALENQGVEDHEMVPFKAADGVTEPLGELLALPE